MLRCGSCDFMFLPAPDSVGGRTVDQGEQVGGDLYGDDYFERYVGGDYLAQEPQRRHEARLRLNALEKLVPPPARLLEVGSAAGFFLHEAHARGYDGIGVEPNPSMAGHAREVLGLDVRTARLEEVDIPAASVDAVCAFHVLEHVDDPLRAVLRCKEAMRPEARLMVEVPNAQSVAARRRRAAWKPLDLPHHVGQHGPHSLRRLMERCGLQPVSIDTVPFAYYARVPALLRGGLWAMESARAGAPFYPRPHPAAHQLLRGVARLRVP